MADDFTPPGRSEDYPAAPQGYDRLLAELSAIKTRLSDLPHGLLRQAGISVEPGVLRVTQDLAVDGQATVAGDLATSGATTLGGDVAITGTLSLPAGIIDNDALANPVQDGAIGYSLTGFNVPTSIAPVATRTITVPSGFTRASVLGIASIGAFNGTSSMDYLYAKTTIDGTGGATMPVRADAGSYATVTVSAIRSISGLTGPTISVSVECYAAAEWGSNGSNIANLDVIALFRR